MNSGKKHDCGNRIKGFEKILNQEENKDEG